MVKIEKIKNRYFTGYKKILTVFMKYVHKNYYRFNMGNIAGKYIFSGN